MRLTFAALAAASMLGGHVPDARAQATDSTWRDHDHAAREARLRGDWRGSVTHLEKMDMLLNGHPGVVLGIARAQAQAGDTGAAIRSLERLVAMGMAHDVAGDTLLGAVRAHREGRDIARRLRMNSDTVGVIRTIAVLPDKDFVAEGITWDPARRRFLVSSIRHRRVVSVGLDGKVAPLLDLARDGAWAALAVATDAAHDRLWVTSEWTPTMIGAEHADSGRSAVLRYDLRRPTRPTRLELPRTAHAPGDIAVASNGDLFVSDARTGSVYMVRNGRDAVDTLVPAGQLVSPQGIAPDPDGRRIFVADYVRGVAAVDRVTGAVGWLPHPPDVMANGIDGMILRGDQLIAVQNGVTPDRIAALDLNAAHTEIVGARVLARDTSRIRQPTHLVAVGGQDNIYLIANGGFGLYGADGKLRPGVDQKAPAIARLRVAPRVLSVPATSDTTRTKVALLAADRALHRDVARRGEEAFLGALEEGAAVLMPFQPILRGASEAAPAMHARYDSPASYEWTPVHAVAAIGGRFGCTVGVSRFVTADDTARSGRNGRYITCWRKDARGRWRIVGHQRSDSQGSPTRVLFDTTMTRAPHSSTVAGASSVRDEVLATERRFAWTGAGGVGTKGPAAAFAEFVADDGLLMPGAELVRGTEEVGRAFDGWTVGNVLVWGPDVRFCGGEGGLAWTTGNSHTRGGDGRVLRRGHFFTVWRQETDGRWRFLFDLGSPRPDTDPP